MEVDKTLFNLQDLVNRFSLIERNHYVANQPQRETDVEHSFSLALLCWYVCVNNSLPLDISKIFKYTLAHDLVEVYAGDVNTFASSEEREDKVKNEAAALKILSDEFGGFQDLVLSMEHYEQKSDEESLFVWTVDKMQALIMGDLDNWRPYKELEINYELFSTKYVELLSNSSPYCKEIFSVLIQYCRSTYYDQPKSQ